MLHGRYDKIDLPMVRPVVTRVERYAGQCPCCGGVTLAAVPVGLEESSPFSVNIVALAIYLRFAHAITLMPRRMNHALRIASRAIASGTPSISNMTRPGNTGAT